MISADVEYTINSFALFKTAVNEGIDEGLEKAGIHIVDLASQLAPKDTEELSKSGQHEVVDKVLTVSFGNDLPDDRAIAQEYGTIFMPAQPYLSVAIREIDVVQEIANAISKRLI